MIYGITKVPDAVKTEWVGLLTYTLNFRWLLPDYQFHAFIGHLWSLCVEWQFYLLWPFVLWHLSLSKLAKLCLLVLPIGMVIRLAIHWVAFRSEGLAAFNNMEQAAVAVYALPFSHIDAFALGAAINLPQIRDFLGSPRVVIALLGVTLASGLTTLGFVSGHYPISSMGWLCTLPEAGQWVWGYTVLNLASAAVIAAVLNNTCAWLKFTEWPFLQYLGKISYGIYVYHSPLVYVVYSVLSKTKPFMGRGVAGLMIVTLLTVVAAHLSYRYWESKFLKIKARVAS